MTVAATTETEAVNIMMAAIGESPVNTLTGTLPADVVMARSTLTEVNKEVQSEGCLLYTSPSPRDSYGSRMPSSA